MKIVFVLYPGGEKAKSNPELLGCAENCLGLRKVLEDQGHTVIAITDSNKELDKHISDMDILVPTPFWPTYMTADRFKKAKDLKLVLTAGIGSDHIDLAAAAKHEVTVAEITGSNVVSVAEHVIMQILALVRNYIKSYDEVVNGGWDIGKIADEAHDLEGMNVGIIGMGRIGQRVASRLQPFDVQVQYYDNRHLSTVEEQTLGASYATLNALVKSCDVVSINCPLTPATEGLFDYKLMKSMKKGAYLVNTARGAIVKTDDLVKIMEEGHLAGYAGDVWYPQPAPKNHPWRKMLNHAMTPHVSGTTIEAQKRYADGVQETLNNFFTKQPIDRDYLIVDKGQIVSASYAYAYKDK